MISRFAKSFLTIVLGLFLLATVAFLHPPSRAYIDPWTGDFFGEGGVEQDLRPPLYDGAKPLSAQGGVIMSKLGNETAKAELGRATWKLLHTMTLRYPERPTQDERDALNSYLHLTSRLYPCGECASEFQELLKKFPPQTGSRLAASLWLCSVHNKVNERLGKPSFDCAHLDETYDCGCGDDKLTSTARQPAPSDSADDPMDLEWDTMRDDVTGVGMIKGGKR
ncbi:ERV/ALR sulfhydryl oxidase domain-containing protein [Suillus placidus]|uniref:Sulfhydryl oxidase n=1 Tax=Suillus placidus TaxID=48579 RepID=A0A9P7A3V9_9AGAM|nr:ERV/ALR sulfhydryl oxidase domain-containing protein [Suillus placidus]